MFYIPRSLVDRSDSKEYSHYFLKQQALTGPLVFFFRKGSVWRRKINIGIRRLTEAGLLQKWYSDLMEERRDVGMRSHNAPLTLHHLQGPFLLFLVGNAIAVVAFLAEILTTNKPWQKEFIARKHNMYQWSFREENFFAASSANRQAKVFLWPAIFVLNDGVYREASWQEKIMNDSAYHKIRLSAAKFQCNFMYINELYHLAACYLIRVNMMKFEYIEWF